MLALIAVLASGGIAPPTPISPANWVTVQDYPVQSLQRREQGVTIFRLIVDTKGDPERCDVIKSSGFKNLDSVTCAVMMRRGRFRPAQDDKGEPIYSTFQRMTAWRIPGGAPLPKPVHVDFDLTVQALPKGVPDPAIVTVRLLTDETGAVQNCAIGDENEGPPALGNAACQQVSTLWRQPTIGLDGKAVRSVQSANVSFTTAKAAPKP